MWLPLNQGLYWNTLNFSYRRKRFERVRWVFRLGLQGQDDLHRRQVFGEIDLLLGHGVDTFVETGRVEGTGVRNGKVYLELYELLGS